MAYVYCHFKEDNRDPFYVGMGKTQTRAWNMSRRSVFHKNIAAKHGVCVEIIIDDIDWDTAQWWEIRWIKALRNDGYNLANHTEGGEGTNGFIPNEEWRRKQSIAHKGKKISEEIKIKMSNSRKGMKFSENHKANLSKAAKKRGAPILSDESKKKISLSKIGKKRSFETIKKMSNSLKGRTAHNKGKPHSEEHKQKLKDAWVLRKARMEGLL